MIPYYTIKPHLYYNRTTTHTYQFPTFITHLVLSHFHFITATLIHSNISIMMNKQVTRRVQYPHLLNPINHIGTYNSMAIKIYIPEYSPITHPQTHEHTTVYISNRTGDQT